jgi:hypothetical protein
MSARGGGASKRMLSLRLNSWTKIEGQSKANSELGDEMFTGNQLQRSPSSSSPPALATNTQASPNKINEKSSGGGRRNDEKDLLPKYCDKINEEWGPNF